MLDALEAVSGGSQKKHLSVNLKLKSALLLKRRLRNVSYAAKAFEAYRDTKYTNESRPDKGVIGDLRHQFGHIRKNEPAGVKLKE